MDGENLNVWISVIQISGSVAIALVVFVIRQKIAEHKDRNDIKDLQKAMEVQLKLNDSILQDLKDHHEEDIRIREKLSFHIDHYNEYRDRKEKETAKLIDAVTEIKSTLAGLDATMKGLHNLMKMFFDKDIK